MRLVNRLEHHDAVMSLAFSPDGALCVTSTEDGVLSLWRVETSELIAEVKVQGHISPRLAYSEDGLLIASGGRDGKVRLWSGKSLTPISTLNYHTCNVRALEFAPNNYLASGGDDGSFHLWSVYTGKFVASRYLFHSIRALAFMPEGDYWKWAAVLQNDQVQVFTAFASSWGLDWQFSVAEASDVSWLHNAFLAIASRWGLTILDANCHSVVSFCEYKGAVSVVSIPELESVVAVSLDKTMTVWSVSLRKPLKVYPCPSEPTQIAYSQSSGLLGVAYWNGLVDFYQVR